MPTPDKILMKKIKKREKRKLKLIARKSAEVSKGVIGNITYITNKSIFTKFRLYKTILFIYFFRHRESSHEKASEKQY